MAKRKKKKCPKSRRKGRKVYKKKATAKKAAKGKRRPYKVKGGYSLTKR